MTGNKHVSAALKRQDIYVYTLKNHHFWFLISSFEDTNLRGTHRKIWWQNVLTQHLGKEASTSFVLESFQF